MTHGIRFLLLLGTFGVATSCLAVIAAALVVRKVSGLAPTFGVFTAIGKNPSEGGTQ